MKRRKKGPILCLALCLALLFCCGCSSGGQGGADGAAPPDQAAEGVQNAPAPPAELSIDQIVDPAAAWEKVCTVEDGTFIEGLNFDANGQLWFIDVAGHKIYTYTDGEVKTVLEDERMMPNGAKFLDDGTLLITDRALGLCVFDPATNEYNVLFSDFNGTPFLGLNDVVLDGAGGAYITDAGNATTTNPISQVYYLTLGDNPSLELFESGIAFANGITYSPDGTRVYVAEFDRNQILCIPAKGFAGPETTRVFARLEGGIGPDGLGVDKDGNVYAAHLEAGEVSVIHPNGLSYGAIRLPAEAGPLVCNLTFHDGYLYVTEAAQSTIWRIPIQANI